MKRGDVCLARLNPVRGSEQSGSRPVIIVSRDAINRSSPVVIAVPITTFQAGRRIYPSQVRINAPSGGLRVDSVALCEQVRAMSKDRLVETWGSLSPPVIKEIDRALLIAMDLPGQLPTEDQTDAGN